MKIVEVIPLAFIPQNIPQVLSYFCPSELPKGAIVEALIGRRKVLAVVISCSSIESEKIRLKKSAFQIKNISKIVSTESQIDDIQFRLALWLSRNYYSSLGICLKTVLPSFFLKRKYPKINFSEPKEEKKKPFYITSPAKKNISAIEELVLQNIREKNQVLILAPELSVVEFYAEYFKKDHDPVVIHGELNNENLYSSWKKTSQGASLVIGSRQALFAPYKNLKLIIVEDPNNEAYKSDMSPLYRTRDLAERMAEIYGSEILYLSPVQSIDDRYYIKNLNYIFQDLSPRPRCEVETINLTDELNSGNFSVFSRKLGQEINSTHSRGGSILIFSSRKGYAGILRCNNCGLMAKCPKCSSPFRVYKTPEPALICHHCLNKLKIPDTCSNCSSYDLKAVGVPGTQKLEQELGKILSINGNKFNIITLDSATTKNNSKEEYEMVKKMSEPGTVAIASQMIFSHRYWLKFDLIALPSADSLLVFPDYKSEEKMLSQLIKLLDFKPSAMILQSYQPDHPVISSLVNYDWENLYDERLETRKSYLYPPFSKLVKLSFAHHNQSVSATKARLLGEKLKMVISQLGLDGKVKILGPSPAYISKEKNEYKYNIILKISLDEKIERILKYISPEWRIDVDPNDTL